MLKWSPRLHPHLLGCWCPQPLAKGGHLVPSLRSVLLALACLGQHPFEQRLLAQRPRPSLRSVLADLARLALAGFLGQHPCGLAGDFAASMACSGSAAPSGLACSRKTCGRRPHQGCSRVPARHLRPAPGLSSSMSTGSGWKMRCHLPRWLELLVSPSCGLVPLAAGALALMV